VPNRFLQCRFLVTVRNVGTASESGVQITDLLPSGLVYQSSSPSQGTYNSSTGIWDVGSLNASASATLQVVARVDSAGTIQNCAELTASAPADINPGNNKGCANVAPTRAFLRPLLAYGDNGPQ